MFDQLLQTDTAQIAVMPIDWPTHFDSLGESTLPPFFTLLAQSAQGEAQARRYRADGDGAGDDGAGSNQAAALHQELQMASVSERQDVLLKYLQPIAAKVLGVHPFQRVAIAESLNTVGLDSLMAMELKNQLETKLNINVAVADLLRGVTLNQIAAAFLMEWSGDASDMAVQGSSAEAGTDANAEWEVLQL
jgi:hypothetical protein